MHPVVYSPRYLEYDFGPGHPFTPKRLLMLTDLLAELGEEVAFLDPPPATREEVLKVHAEHYVRRVEAASQGEVTPDLVHYGLGTSDNPVFPGMDEAARAVAGGTLFATRLVATGRAKRALQLGGGLHHAQRDRASGFCIYNDLAIAIADVLELGLKVAYIDIDVHHGDGVQWIFYDDPRVLTISLHESGRYLFPGTGFVHEIGRGPAVGTKLNLPLLPYTDDASWIEVFELVVPRALAAFAPDLILVQSGADAHAQDPLAHLRLSTRAYEHAFSRLLELAEALTEGRIVFTLGGGYSLDATPRVWALLYYHFQKKAPPPLVPESWRRRWKEPRTPTLRDPAPPEPLARSEEIRRENLREAKRLLELVGLL